MCRSELNRHTEWIVFRWKTISKTRKPCIGQRNTLKLIEIVKAAILATRIYLCILRGYCTWLSDLRLLIDWAIFFALLHLTILQKTNGPCKQRHNHELEKPSLVIAKNYHFINIFSCDLEIRLITSNFKLDWVKMISSPCRILTAICSFVRKLYTNTYTYCGSVAVPGPLKWSIIK